MRRLCLATICLLAGGFAATAPAVAQSQARSEQCYGKMNGDVCEVSETGARAMEWNRMVREQEDMDAQRRQLNAEAKASAYNGKMSRLQEIMHRRHAAAAPGNN